MFLLFFTERQVINMAKLTEQQKRFVDEYLIDLNATRAYKAAYKSVKKDEVAASAAVRLLRNVKVQEYMKKRQQKLQERTEITQDMVLLELAKIAFSNGSDFAKVVTKPRKRQVWNDTTQEYEEKEFDEQFVELVDTDSLPAEKKAAISSIKETKFGIAVESCDKVKALELIGKHLGMFKDKVEISGQVNNPMEGLTTEELKKLIYDG
jgi:phage terminase small subunit